MNSGSQKFLEFSERPSPPAMKGQARNVDQAGLLLLVIVGCVGGIVAAVAITLPSWRPKADMNRQPYHKPFTPSLAFADGMSQRPLVSGVVPRPQDQSPGIPYVVVRDTGPANYPVIAATTTIPMPITRALLDRGQRQYTIFCSMCHGNTGRGDGMIVLRGFYPPPSYHDQRLRDAPDSHFFNVITNGYGTMFGYSERVGREDRWAIVAYIRALQLAVEQSPELRKQLQKPAGVLP